MNINENYYNYMYKNNRLENPISPTKHIHIDVSDFILNEIYKKIKTTDLTNYEIQMLLLGGDLEKTAEYIRFLELNNPINFLDIIGTPLNYYFERADMTSDFIIKNSDIFLEIIPVRNYISYSISKNSSTLFSDGKLLQWIVDDFVEYDGDIFKDREKLVLEDYYANLLLSFDYNKEEQLKRKLNFLEYIDECYDEDTIYYVLPYFVYYNELITRRPYNFCKFTARLFRRYYDCCELMINNNEFMKEYFKTSVSPFIYNFRSLMYMSVFFPVDIAISFIKNHPDKYISDVCEYMIPNEREKLVGIFEEAQKEDLKTRHRIYDFMNNIGDMDTLSIAIDNPELFSYITFDFKNNNLITQIAPLLNITFAECLKKLEATIRTLGEDPTERFSIVRLLMDKCALSSSSKNMNEFGSRILNEDIEAIISLMTYNKPDPDIYSKMVEYILYIFVNISSEKSIPDEHGKAVSRGFKDCVQFIIVYGTADDMKKLFSGIYREYFMYNSDTNSSLCYSIFKTFDGLNILRDFIIEIYTNSDYSRYRSSIAKANIINILKNKQDFPDYDDILILLEI